MCCVVVNSDAACGKQCAGYMDDSSLTLEPQTESEKSNGNGRTITSTEFVDWHEKTEGEK